MADNHTEHGEGALMAVAVFTVAWLHPTRNRALVTAMQLWRLQLPANLAAGEHTAAVTATDVDGRTFTQDLTFRVAG